ncbi:addiction module antidote protein, HigA family [Herbaspirillum rubrisubalbicans]|uniref:Addiction module antidote protein, HigA family n=3 Tax=Herbaspirillum rubrisubalbicans TaxID=80842 RepID=A0AAD0UF08_9BURK|nr:HigA family addiction module antitoxin [Herbaspirillum rubrisubalbicans]AYR26365.1 addiction module antidote protein, HigA family [Herbaspirillum rubrisubalbicans]
MRRMFNQPHPGSVLRAYFEGRSIAALARHIGMSRVTLQRIVNGAAGISPDMAYRLAAAFGTSPELWAGMQLQYDLHEAGKLERPVIERITA